LRRADVFERRGRIEGFPGWQVVDSEPGGGERDDFSPIL
jgi:hypothetical protein